MGFEDGTAEVFFAAPFCASGVGVLAGTGVAVPFGAAELFGWSLLPTIITASETASTTVPTIISRRSRVSTLAYFKYRRMKSAAARSRTRMPAEGGAVVPATTTPAR